MVSMNENFFSWIFFIALIGFCLAIDLRIHKQRPSALLRHAIFWSLFWIGISLAFNVWVYFRFGKEDALAFLAGYLVEKSLSVDNLFVFLLIFRAFQIPQHFRHDILFWGIFGAFLMRAVFIATGIALVSTFHWALYLFGAFLVYTGVKLFFPEKEALHPEKNPLILWLQQWIPVTTRLEGGNFFVREKEKIVATPLFLALMAIEVSDLIFAVDSIPAILGITTKPFIVYTSNIFAILGLRSLYFVLEKMFDLFHYLHYGLAVVLTFIGIKMLIVDFVDIPIEFSLAFILVSLLLSIGASLLMPLKNKS